MEFLPSHNDALKKLSTDSTVNLPNNMLLLPNYWVNGLCKIKNWCFFLYGWYKQKI